MRYVLHCRPTASSINLPKLTMQQVLTADIDERAIGDRSSNPEGLVLELARAKAAAIAQKLTPSQKVLLITCDQVVVHEGKILEKPTTEKEVRNSKLTCTSAASLHWKKDVC